ncbi:DUF3833 domain-containing protein [Cupriavidus basilensis]
MTHIGLPGLVHRRSRCRRWLLCSVFSLAACAGPDVSRYAQQQPVLDVPAFFTGKTEAWGMFQKRGGEVVKRFTVAIEGSQQGNDFVLEEHFNYSDGTTERRTWTLARQLDGTWRGRAGDVVGEAIGHSAGNALNWRYTLRLPVGNTTYDVQFDDWMYLVDAHTMINRASVSKFGFEVGQVTVFFSRPR